MRGRKWKESKHMRHIYTENACGKEKHTENFSLRYRSMTMNAKELQETRLRGIFLIAML